MTSTYTPRAGSIAGRAIEILREAGEMRSAELASRLDVSTSSLATNLSWPMRQGALVSRLISEPGARETLIWSLPGDTLPDAEDPPTPAPTVRNAFDMAPKLRTPPPPEREKPIDLGIPIPMLVPARHRAIPAPAPAPAPTLLATRFAIWSDGHLEIERAGETVVILLPEETRCLAFYLERLGVEVPA